MPGVSVVLTVQRASWAPHASLTDAAASASKNGGSVFACGSGVVIAMREATGWDAKRAGVGLARTMMRNVSGLVVGMSAPTGVEIETAERQAGEAAALAHCCPRVPTTLADCPAEVALLRDPVAVAYATERIGALADKLELLSTLEAYFVRDGDRRATAKTLGVHIRTLDHRLRRSEDLTGLSARRAYDSRLIVAGLTARRSADVAALPRTLAAVGGS